MPALHCWYADDHLVVIEKPTGLLSVPGRGPDKQDCASARAQAHWPDALIVHRLDMATSGLLLMARGAEMQRVLSIAFAQREVHKRYVAVVHGHLADDAGEVEAPLLTDWPNRPRQIVHPEGKPSLTRWQVLSRSSDVQGRPITRLSLEPVTGRSHQLRVHLLSIGHAIVGDALYAPPDLHHAAPRLLLHASELALPHPRSGAALQWHSPAPF